MVDVKRKGGGLGENGLEGVMMMIDEVWDRIWMYDVIGCYLWSNDDAIIGVVRTILSLTLHHKPIKINYCGIRPMAIL